MACDSLFWLLCPFSGRRTALSSFVFPPPDRMQSETTPITGWVWFSLETKQLQQDGGVLRSNNLSANTRPRQTQQVLPLSSLSCFASTWGPFQWAGFSTAHGKEVRQCALWAPPASADKVGAKSWACAVILRECRENYRCSKDPGRGKVKEETKSCQQSVHFSSSKHHLFISCFRIKRVSFIEDTNQLWLLQVVRVFFLCIQIVKYSASTRCF